MICDSTCIDSGAAGCWIRVSCAESSSTVGFFMSISVTGDSSTAARRAVANSCMVAKRCFCSLESALKMTCSIAGGNVGSRSRSEGGRSVMC